ncbi:Flagellar hook-length control protein FliK [Gammaproteobacteria bacterium MOLA455]|nr:Flagellar hook-length control protein FliK [Gammaproteobacteria bacterium MOLA455]
MLGPELINLTARPTPIFLEGSAAIQLTQQAAKDLGLKDGQIVQGVITARGDLLKLLINNRELEWPGSSRFKPGDRLDFRVDSSIFGRLLVPIRGLTTAPGNTPPAIPSPALLQLMHRPDQPSVLARLFKSGGIEALAAQLGGSEQLRASLMLSMAKLSPMLIKRGLSNSGLFGEQLLARGVVRQAPDLKQLLRSLLRNVPLQSAIGADLKGAIEEVESKQLESLQAQQSRELSYSFVLPFMDANAVEIELYREASNSAAEDQEWIINLHTESPSLGELWLKTTLQSAASIHMVMWAPRVDVADRARDAASELQSELQRFGLTLEKLDVLNARRPSASEGLSGSGQMVDLST